MKIAVSQYAFGTETDYVEFDLTREGQACRGYLSADMAKGHRRAVSPWMFDGSHATALSVGHAIMAGDYAEAARIAESDPVLI